MGEKLVGATRAGKVAAALGAVVVLGGLVAGCGSSGAADTATDTANAQGSETSTSAAPGGADASATPSSSPDAKPAADPADHPAAAPEPGAASPADQNRVLLEAALSGGDPVLCAFAQDGTEGAMAIRGEDSFRFEGTSEKGPIQMVRDGATLYLWQPGATQGLSMDVTAQPGDEQPVSPSSLEADVDSLRCERYTGAADAFGVPGGVNFIPLDALPGGGQN